MSRPDPIDWTAEDERRAIFREGLLAVGEHPVTQSDPTREALSALAFIVREYGETILDEAAWEKVYAIFPGESQQPRHIEAALIALAALSTPPPSLDVERLRAEIEAELALTPRRKRPQFDAGAAAAYHFVLSLLGAPHDPE